MNKNSSVLRALPIVAKALGDKLGIQVTMEGQTAFTDGSRINLPVLPDDDTTIMMARGYLDHEAGHVRMTDFGSLPSPSLLGTLTNIIEDVRVEKGIGAIYPGSAINLKKLAEYLHQNGAFTPKKTDSQQIFLAWLLSYGRSRFLSQDLGTLPATTGKALEALLGKKLVMKLHPLAGRIGDLTSTRDTVHLAEEILKLLQDEQQKMNQPQDSKNQKNSDKNESDPDSNPDQSNSGQDDCLDDQDSPSDSSSGAGSSDKAAVDENPNSTSDTDADGGNSPSQSSSDSQDGKSETTRQETVSDSDAADGKGSGAGAPPPETQEKIQDILNKNPNGFGDIGEYLEQQLSVKSQDRGSSMCLPPEEKLETTRFDASSVRRETAQLRAKLAGLVQASRLKRSFPKRTGRKINGRLIPRLSVGDTRIFQSQQEKTAVNTACVILLDRSGSMSGRKIEVATQGVYAAATALSDIPGVAVSTAAFPSYKRHKEGIALLTRFGQKVKPEDYGISENGGTPLHKALWWAGVELVRRNEPRKILLVATDGDPDSTSLSKKAVEILQKERIEILGLGICHAAVQDFFPNSRTINDVTEMPKALIEMLQDTLTKGGT